MYFVIMLIFFSYIHFTTKQVKFRGKKDENIKKGNLKNSDDQTNIDKYRLAANITEYEIISKLIFLRINIPKSKFHVKNACKNIKKNMFKMDVRTFWSVLVELLKCLHPT